MSRSVRSKIHVQRASLHFIKPGDRVIAVDMQNDRWCPRPVAAIGDGLVELDNGTTWRMSDGCPEGTGRGYPVWIEPMGHDEDREADGWLPYQSTSEMAAEVGRNLQDFAGAPENFATIFPAQIRRHLKALEILFAAQEVE